MTFGNTFRAGLLALGMGMGLGTMSGCGQNPYAGDQDPIPGLPGEDGGLPDTPLNRFNHCFPPNRSLQVHLDGRGAAWGSPRVTQAEGQSVLQIDRASLSLLGGGDAGTSNRFTGLATWASAPTELYTQNPGDAGYGLMATRAAARANGEPLTSLRRSGMTGSWAEQFPGFADGANLGLLWIVEGDFEPGSCRTNLRLHGAVRRTNGLTGPQDFVAVPLYSQRPDGQTEIAASTFSNEGLAVLNNGEGLEMAFEFPSGEGPNGRVSSIASVCDGDCDPVAGSGLTSLDAQLIILTPTDDAGPGDAGTGGADAGSGGSDSGTPDGG